MVTKDLITGKGVGLDVIGGVIFSVGNNQVFGNVTDGSPNGSIVSRGHKLGPTQIWRKRVDRSRALKRAAHHRHHH